MTAGSVSAARSNANYEIFPDYFRCRTPEQGVWMPFHKISKVEGWEDFGFKFKEGNNETAWDDAHGILTFRYTEPMTWWMRMPKEMPRTMEAAIAEARRLADAGRSEAKALFTSGYHDENGRFAARLLDTPWCNGAVWSMNSMPGIQGDVTDWSLKWGAAVREKVYGPNRKGDLDGEYIDSSEGYVTDELDFRREHFAAARLPLTFSPDSRKPAIFRGCIIGEYNRQMAEDVHAMGKLMMANSTPIRLCWLAPWLDVMGTETDWNPPGQRGVKRSEATTHVWRPMSDADLLYRRAMCGAEAVLLPDEHALPRVARRADGEVHEAQSRLWNVPRLLQRRRLHRPLLLAARALQPRPSALQEIHPALQARCRGRLAAVDARAFKTSPASTSSGSARNC